MINEQLRFAYRPTRVSLLFIGESPPASGRFFYARNSGLYRAVLEVFQTVDPSIAEPAFLNTFKNSGCYLIDLCPDPVDRMSLSLRRAAHRAGEAHLAEEIRRMQPGQIVTTLRSIERNTASAIAQAEWTGPALVLPYPGRWKHLRDRFAATLGPVIERLLHTKEPQ